MASLNFSLRWGSFDTIWCFELKTRLDRQQAEGRFDVCGKSWTVEERNRVLLYGKWGILDFGPTLVGVLLSISPSSLFSPGFEIITKAVVVGFSNLDFGTKDWSTEWESLV